MTATPGDEKWEPDNTHDDYWGADDTEWLAGKKAEKKALAREERQAAQMARPRGVNNLDTEVVEWEQPDDVDVTLLDEINAAHKALPQPVTYTVVNSSTDLSDPSQRCRLFGNLVRQLTMEKERAVKCGSWVMLAPEVTKEVLEYTARPLDAWLDTEMDMFEPRVREMVKALIQKRRDVELGS